MSRDIIRYDDPEYKGLLVNTFWGGIKGECVQITEGGPGNNDWEGVGYVHMTREEAIVFFQTALDRLKTQIESDSKEPPWWQEISKSTPKKPSSSPRAARSRG